MVTRSAETGSPVSGLRAKSVSATAAGRLSERVPDVPTLDVTTVYTPVVPTSVTLSTVALVSLPVGVRLKLSLVSPSIRSENRIVYVTLALFVMGSPTGVRLTSRGARVSRWRPNTAGGATWPAVVVAVYR